MANFTAVEIMALLSIYTPLFYLDILTCPCPNPDVGLDLC